MPIMNNVNQNNSETDSNYNIKMHFISIQTAYNCEVDRQRALAPTLRTTEWYGINELWCSVALGETYQAGKTHSVNKY